MIRKTKKKKDIRNVNHFSLPSTGNNLGINQTVRNYYYLIKDKLRINWTHKFYEMIWLRISLSCQLIVVCPNVSIISSKIFFVKIHIKSDLLKQFSTPMLYGTIVFCRKLVLLPLLWKFLPVYNIFITCYIFIIGSN